MLTRGLRVAGCALVPWLALRLDSARSRASAGLALNVLGTLGFGFSLPAGEIALAACRAVQGLGSALVNVAGVAMLSAAHGEEVGQAVALQTAWPTWQRHATVAVAARG